MFGLLLAAQFSVDQKGKALPSPLCFCVNNKMHTTDTAPRPSPLHLPADCERVVKLNRIINQRSHTQSQSGAGLGWGDTNQLQLINYSIKFINH